MDDVDDVFVTQVMSEELYTVSPDTLVEDAAGGMMDRGVGSVVVVDGDELAGILTSTDFVRIVAERRPKDRTPVSEYMTEALVTTSPGAAIAEAAATMLEDGIHHLPVTDDDGVVGVVSTTDLAAYLSRVP